MSVMPVSAIFGAGLFRRIRYSSVCTDLAKWIWIAVHPREIVWRFLQHSRHSSPVVVRVKDDIRISVRPGDVVGHRIFVAREYEPSTSQWIRGYLKPGMVFVDVGANLGWFTLLAARCVGAEGWVHSFEPNSVMADELRQNAALNGFSNITINELAVSDRSGTVDFPRYRAGEEAYGTINPRVWPGTRILGYDKVRTTTLDEYVDERKIARVDLIKLDIEGASI